MKPFVMLFVAALIMSSVFAFAQAVPSPTVAPVTGTLAVIAPAPTGIAGWIHTSGGLIAAVTAVLISLNIALSALAQIFAKLAVQEPGWLQTIGSVVFKLVQYASANTSTPAPMVQAQLDAQKKPAS